MNRNDLRKIDFSLLITFETIMYERNLTRAAEKLFVCQPSISASLNRLRQYFDDPLFIRTGRSMEPTSRAFEIQRLLAPALDTMAAALSNVKEFDPLTSSEVFRIGLSDDVEYALLPGLMSQLRQEAPNISLVVRRTDQFLMASQFSTGQVSMCVCHSSDLPANAKRKSLWDTRPTVLSSSSVKNIMNLDEYCNRPHVIVSLNGEMSDNVDRVLIRLGRQRQVMLAVSQFSSLVTLLEASEMVAVVPEYVASVMTAQSGLRQDPLPISVPNQDLSLCWNSTSDNDPAERWLRSRLSRHLCATHVAAKEIFSKTAA